MPQSYIAALPTVAKLLPGVTATKNAGQSLTHLVAVASHVHDAVQILMKEPEQRLSLHEVMQHPWVTQNGACPVPTVAASGLQVCAYLVRLWKFKSKFHQKLLCSNSFGC